VDEDLVRFLDSFRPHGSTDLTAPLAQAAAWAFEARRGGQQPIVVLVSDGRPTRGPLDLDLETAYSRISYEHDMPVFAMAVRPTNHDDESVLHNLSHYHHGDLVTVYDDVPNSVANLLASVRVPVLQDLRAEFPSAATSAFASANPEIVWQGGEAAVIAKLRGTTNDSLALRISWSDPSGAAQAIDVRSAGRDIPVQPLLKRQWVLTRVHALLDAVHARANPGELAELTSLATESRVATPYTSLLVLLPQRNQGGERSAPDGPISALPAFGPGAGLASAGGPASSSPGFVFPLLFEARKAEALRRDLANPLVVADEVDRYVDVGSAEYAQLNLAGATSRYEGTYLRIFEIDGQLVGVRSGFTDTSQIVANGFGFVGMILTVTALVRLSRRKAGSHRDMDSIDSVSEPGSKPQG
jgi:hypothetical protein